MGLFFFPLRSVSRACIVGRIALGFQTTVKQAFRQKGVCWGRNLGLFSPVVQSRWMPSLSECFSQLLGVAVFLSFLLTLSSTLQCKEPDVPAEESSSKFIS